MADKIKFTIALLLLIAGIVAFRWMTDAAIVLRVLVVVAGVVLAALVAWQTTHGKRFMVFVKEAIVETRKVVWPSRKETVQTTLVVFGFVVVMAFFLYLTDKTLEWVLYDLVLGWRQ